MDDNNYYEARLDKIFSKGGLWNHRTFRTVLDPLSSEYNKTTMEQKISYLKRLIENKESLDNIVFDYKDRYLEQNRKDIAIQSEVGLIRIIEFLLKSE